MWAATDSWPVLRFISGAMVRHFSLLWGDPPALRASLPSTGDNIHTQETSTHVQGSKDVGFEDIVKGIDRWVEDGAVRGASIAITHRGEIVAMHQAGEARPGARTSPETLFALASVSKPFTAAAVMRVIEQGLFSLDDDVVTILPDFASVDDPFADDVLPQLEARRESITFRHLLAHTSGLPENIGIKRLRARDLPSLDQQVDTMMTVPLASAPGEILRYSNLGPAIAARAAETAAATPFHDLLQHTILDTMELDDIILRPDKAYDERIAIVQDPSNEGTGAESYNSAYWRKTGITWGGYFGTPLAVLDFAASFLPGRDSALSDESIRAMTTDQAGGAPGGVESMGVRWDPGFWGIGWEVKGDKRRHWTGTKTSHDTWCHWGQAGTLVWVDPTRDLGVAMFANRTVRTLWPFRPARWSDISDAIVDAADERA